MDQRADGRASIALGAILTCAAAAPAAAQELDVVADGLSNPRGISFGPSGKLYVAEAGRGGGGACVPSPEGGESCLGKTGAIARVNVRSGVVRRILKALPSLAAQAGAAPGADAIGPQDVSFRHRRAYFTIGLSADPARRAALGKGGRRLAGLSHRPPRRRASRRRPGRLRAGPLP